jgi:hypothetical protein
MSKKERTATQQLNIAIAGAEASMLVAMGAVGHNHKDDAVRKSALQRAQRYLDDARQHLITIQFHVGQI